MSNLKLENCSNEKLYVNFFCMTHCLEQFWKTPINIQNHKDLIMDFVFTFSVTQKAVFSFPFWCYTTKGNKNIEFSVQSTT